MLRGLEQDDQCRIHRERKDDGGRIDQGTAEQRFLTLRGAYELAGYTPPAGQEKRTGPTGAGDGEIGPRVRLGALLYCGVDVGKALQGDRTLTRDVDSIVDQKQRLLQELMRPKLRRNWCRTSPALPTASAEGVC